MAFSGIGRLLDRIMAEPRPRLLTIALSAMSAIAVLDWSLGEAVTLGALYLLPVILLSGAVTRTQLYALILLCVTLRMTFNPPVSLLEGVMNGVFALLAYGLIGTFAAELIKNRQEIQGHLREVQHQQTLRIEAEEQLRVLAESSPAAIFTLNGNGEVLSANKSTTDLIGWERAESLIGMQIGTNFPVLAEALKLDIGGMGFRTVSQVQGKRCDGTPFLAQACFSTYTAEDGSPRLAAIAFDSTEDTREREEQSQQQLRESNRIIAGAVAHEVRNVCSAMSVVHANLERVPGVADSRDYVALGNLVHGLGKLARLELHGGEEARGSSADIRDVLSQLRILIEPGWRDEQGQVDWPRIDSPLLVAVDSFTLLQAFLNIVNNSRSAVARMPEKRLTISFELDDGRLHLAFSDTGHGVAEPGALFQPFRTGASKVGLGLYISKALVRRYGGDVRYEPTMRGARFIVEVPLYGVSTDAANANKRNPAFAGR